VTEPVFQVEAVTHSFDGVARALDGVSLSVMRGEFIGIIGPNGAGKSTLLNVLTGWIVPEAGAVRFRGTAIGAIPRRAYAREVAVVPQREEGAGAFTAEEVVLMGRYAHQPPLVGFDDAEDRAIARGVLALTGMAAMAQRRMATLSGGERQRVLVARALAQCPEALLLDEPTASLDLGHQRDVFGLLERLNQAHGLTVVAVTHDINLAALYCRRLIVMKEGRVVADGAPEAILREDLLTSLYGVPIDVSRDPQGHPRVGMLK